MLTRLVCDGNYVGDKLVHKDLNLNNYYKQYTYPILF